MFDLSGACSEGNMQYEKPASRMEPFTPFQTVVDGRIRDHNSSKYSYLEHLTTFLYQHLLTTMLTKTVCRMHNW